MRKSIERRRKFKQRLSQTEQPVATALRRAASHADPENPGNVSSEELRYVSYAVERLECPVTVEVIAAIIDLSVAVHAALKTKRKKENAPT